VFGSAVLRRKLGPKRDAVTGEQRRLHKDHYDLYWSPSIFRVIESRRMRWTGHVTNRVLVWIPEGKRTLRRP
jgi:hypothetical protein